MFFDDMKVTLNESAVVQQDSYYPYGLTFNSNRRAYGDKNNYLFNSSSEYNDFTGYYEMPLRHYSPATGRMTGVDPYASSYLNESPYSFSGNNPIYYSDPSGGSYADLSRDDEFVNGGYRVFNGGGGYIPSRAFGWSQGIYRNDWSLAYGSDSYRKEQYISEQTGGYQKGQDFYNGDGGLIVTKNGKQGQWIDYYTNGIVDAEHYINSEFRVYDAQNGGGCPPGEDCNESNARNAITVLGMLMDYLYGKGPEHTTFSNDGIANAMRDSPGVNQARDLWYKEARTGRDMVNKPLTGVAASFTFPIGIINAGSDPVEQFIGTFRVQSIELINNGTELRYTLTNRTSFNSLMYHIAPSWPRSAYGPMGNTYQTYIFTEPINYKRLP
ncbi:hypothetical protein C900_02844 [Fulvivirga imtechensis AK7]|uniref:RHS repeat-associated core domain-containing protein n=1 Tax=Fulvivirga imtechensis AK7 TaxID=1237149 RepID=L8JUJ9_9BACT|nr:hypothetical protein C900_02844 [Fulvivirga imtechensis AK7]